MNENRGQGLSAVNASDHLSLEWRVLRMPPPADKCPTVRIRLSPVSSSGPSYRMQGLGRREAARREHGAMIALFEGLYSRPHRLRRCECLVVHFTESIKHHSG
jgi:hypothetical protein